MSAVLHPTPGKGGKPASPVLPSPAAANAAAASFAALTARLDYLEPAEVDLVRKAYRFADEAHLGQILPETVTPENPVAGWLMKISTALIFLMILCFLAIVLLRNKL